MRLKGKKLKRKPTDWQKRTALLLKKQLLRNNNTRKNRLSFKLYVMLKMPEPKLKLMLLMQKLPDLLQKSPLPRQSIRSSKLLRQNLSYFMR
jgi:hypothetical protein